MGVAMVPKRWRANLVCAVMGILVPIPLLPLYAFIPIDVDEGIAPAMLFLYCLGVGWSSSLLVGVCCRRILAGQYDIVAVLLANSSGWLSLPLFIVLILKLPYIVTAQDIIEAFVFLLYAIVLSFVGFAITWIVMTTRARRIGNPSE
jgi:hypothetical protein